MTDGSLRLDRYLWQTRLVKTRSLAQRLCAAGRVRLNGLVELKPARPVRCGDVVTLEHGGASVTLEILALGVRRGPAGEAQALYRETARRRIERGDPAWERLLAEDDDD